MDEQTSFEARPVLAPRRARRARLALLLPVVALVGIAWAGLNGAPANQATAELPTPTAVDAPSVRPPELPAQVIGFDVKRLDEVQLQALDRNDVIAVAGWYVPMSITDCPPLAVLFRASAPPEVRGTVDGWAFCQRSGVLYASSPDIQDSWSGSAGLGAVAVTLGRGVMVPPELELIGTHATEVVVLGHFVESGDGCRGPAGCGRELVVDHLAWTPDA